MGWDTEFASRCAAGQAFTPAMEHLEKVRHAAYRVTDPDIDELHTIGFSDDEIFGMIRERERRSNESVVHFPNRQRTRRVTGPRLSVHSLCEDRRRRRANGDLALPGGRRSGSTQGQHDAPRAPDGM